jgi:hypothetical protein
MKKLVLTNEKIQELWNSDFFKNNFADLDQDGLSKAFVVRSCCSAQLNLQAFEVAKTRLQQLPLERLKKLKKYLNCDVIVLATATGTVVL